jgi:hypothetical protein
MRPLTPTLFLAGLIALPALVLSLPASARSGAVMLMAGPKDAAHAIFSVAGKRDILVETFQAGVEGSRIEVFIDKDRVPVLSHLYGANECRFSDAGSRCRVTIRRGTKDYAALLRGFRLGRQARVVVTDAGVMTMEHRASLDGVMRALDR